MKKQIQKAELSSPKKAKRKPEQPVKDKKPKASSSTGSSPALREKNLEAQASLLRHMPAAQRQDAVRQIGQLSGNRYVDRLVRSIEHDAVQTKLEVSTPGDQHEQEAEETSKRVMTMPGPQNEEELATKPLQRQKDEEELQAKSLQRQEDEKELQAKSLAQRREHEEELQTKSAQGGELEASGDVEAKLSSAKGGGQPLPGETQEFMESRFGTDFGGVRVHADSQAAQLSQGLEAEAFTHGKDVYFASGKYDPGTSSGKHLLAHELSHVVQQGGAPAKRQAEEQDAEIAKPAQRQAEEEEKATDGPAQRQAEEEEVTDGPVQRQAEDKEPVNVSPAQRKAEEEIQTKAATVGVSTAQNAQSAAAKAALVGLRPYRVKIGEGLQILAKKLGVLVETLKALNKQKLRRWGNAEGFQAGELIMVPSWARMPQNTQKVEPRAQAIFQEIAIAYGPNADKSTVTEYSLKVLKDLLGAAGEKRALITSTTRDPARQATAMVEELRHLGVGSQRALYDRPGNMVIDLFVRLQAQAMPTPQIIAAMETKIKELGAMNVSAHCQDPKVLQAIDIDPNLINNPAEFLKALMAAKEVGLIAKFILPPTYPAYHIEIPQGKKIF